MPPLNTRKLLADLCSGEPQLAEQALLYINETCGKDVQLAQFYKVASALLPATKPIFQALCSSNIIEVQCTAGKILWHLAGSGEHAAVLSAGPLKQILDVILKAQDQVQSRLMVLVGRLAVHDQRAVAASGAVKAALVLLEQSSDASTLMHTLNLLANLTRQNLPLIKAIAAAGVMPHAIRLATYNDPEVRHVAFGVITHICSLPEIAREATAAGALAAIKTAMEDTVPDIPAQPTTNATTTTCTITNITTTMPIQYHVAAAATQALLNIIRMDPDAVKFPASTYPIDALIHWLIHAPERTHQHIVAVALMSISENHDIRHSLAAAAIYPTLVQRMRVPYSAQHDVRGGAVCLLGLSVHSLPAAQLAAIRAGALPAAFKLLSQPKAEIHVVVAVLLSNLVAVSSPEAHKAAVAAGMLPGLQKALQDSQAHEHAKQLLRDAAKALAGSADEGVARAAADVLGSSSKQQQGEGGGGSKGAGYVCEGCGVAPGEGEKFKRCARCKAVRFCSAECQKRCWKVHKPSCVPAP